MRILRCAPCAGSSARDGVQHIAHSCAARTRATLNTGTDLKALHNLFFGILFMQGLTGVVRTLNDFQTSGTKPHAQVGGIDIDATRSLRSVSGVRAETPNKSLSSCVMCRRRAAAHQTAWR